MKNIKFPRWNLNPRLMVFLAASVLTIEPQCLLIEYLRLNKYIIYDGKYFQRGIRLQPPGIKEILLVPSGFGYYC